MGRIWESPQQKILSNIEKAFKRSVLEKFKPDMSKIKYAFLAYSKEDFCNNLNIYLPKTQVNKKALSKLKNKVKIVDNENLKSSDSILVIAPKDEKMLSAVKQSILQDLKDTYVFYGKSDFKEYINYHSPYKLPEDVFAQADNVYDSKKSNIKQTAFEV